MLSQHIATREHHNITSFFPYKNALIRTCIHEAKFHNNTHASVLLGATIAPYFAEELSERRMFSTHEKPLLIPIPLHPKRLRERGFNQSTRIAQALMAEIETTHITLCLDVLARTKYTEAQTRQVNKAKRFENISEAFTVTQQARVAEKDIILFDDVVTTGATLASAVATLRIAGARQIWCVAVAH